MKVGKTDEIMNILAKELWEINNLTNKKTDTKSFKLLKMKLSSEKKHKIDRRSKVFLPPKKYYLSLVTSRNKNLITQEKQNLLNKTTIAFLGLSVGSHAALTWMMLSRADKIKISDPDIISPTNLNRLRFGWNAIGKLKVDVVKKQLQEMNPYCKVHSFNSKGIVDTERIIIDKPKPDLIVDSMDDLESKVFVRLLASKYKIPVLMATDVGDNVFLDIERYDKLPRPLLFNGRVKNIEKIDFSQISSQAKIKISMQIVGLEHNSEEMLNSLLSIGKTIKTWPQLGSTATVAGGLLATIIKKIVLGEEIKNGRYYLLLDGFVTKNYYSKKRISVRNKLASKLTSILD